MYLQAARRGGGGIKNDRYEARDLYQEVGSGRARRDEPVTARNAPAIVKEAGRSAELGYTLS